MSGPEHVRRAEQLLTEAAEVDEQLDKLTELVPSPEVSAYISSLAARARAHLVVASMYLELEDRILDEADADPAWQQLLQPPAAAGLDEQLQGVAMMRSAAQRNGIDL
jgi:hypothetical protein